MLEHFEQKYLFLNLNDPRILALEANVQSRAAEYSRQNSLIKALLNWRVMYRELYVRVASVYSTRFPLDHIENLDKMYEIWVLLELLDYLRNEDYLIKTVSFPKEFNIEKGPEKFKIFYEKRYSGWSSVAGLPDFTVESNGQIVAVLDAKNWLLHNRKEAIYKMLGYMNNFDASTGVLFFPTTAQLGNKRTHYCGPNVKYHKDQCLYNCVLYPSPSIEGYNSNLENLRELHSLIRNKLQKMQRSDDHQI